MSKSQNDTNSASAYFNENWMRYQSVLKHNTLYHREMIAALNGFLSEHYGDKAFDFVDVGCGDSSTVASVLADTSITTYIGIDAAKDVLKIAANNVTAIGCDTSFVADNMTTAIPNLASSVDIIYTSYAVHHLSLEDKFDFINSCKQQLKPNGVLLLVDGVLEHNQTREAWLDALRKRMGETIPDLSADELDFRMKHPSVDDFPESIETYSTMAKEQAWSSFDVLVDKGTFAFMVFRK
jgi:2-polyprenyl-3-methyl-5-hydroxy-6-metoxy-1,4-benzoquinol methylase